jgi:predicted RNA polymerase sigma factor
MANIDTTLEDAEFRLLCEEVRISCTYGMLLCIPRAQRAAYLLADVIGLTDVEGAEILDCSREAFRQRVARARRTLRHVTTIGTGWSTRPTRAGAAARSPPVSRPDSPANLGVPRTPAGGQRVF